MDKESNDDTTNASDKKEVTELKLAKFEVENAKEAQKEIIAEKTDDIAIDNSKPNLETAKENSKADGNNAAEVSTSPEMCDCSISFPNSNLNL